MCKCIVYVNTVPKQINWQTVIGSYLYSLPTATIAEYWMIT